MSDDEADPDQGPEAAGSPTSRCRRLSPSVVDDRCASDRRSGRLGPAVEASSDATVMDADASGADPDGATVRRSRRATRSGSSMPPWTASGRTVVAGVVCAVGVAAAVGRGGRRGRGPRGRPRRRVGRGRRRRCRAVTDASARLERPAVDAAGRRLAGLAALGADHPRRRRGPRASTTRRPSLVAC